MIWRTTSWCQIISKRFKSVWNTSQLFRTFPKMFKCLQNRSKQTVVKSAKFLKLENTLVSLKTQIPANTEVKTQCHRNCIQWNTVHSRTFSAHQKCRISMNTEVNSIIEASSNELLYQIEAHNGLIPAYIGKKHDGPIPHSHYSVHEKRSSHRTQFLCAHIHQCRDCVLFFRPSSSWLLPGRNTVSCQLNKLYLQVTSFQLLYCLTQC